MIGAGGPGKKCGTLGSTLKLNGVVIFLVL